MKTIAYTPLLYGRDFLASAIRSVIDAVDEYWVLYTPIGSHGHRSDVPCPESRDELYEIARQASGNKFHWHEGTFAYEGQQRDHINALVPDADLVLALDADEVWSEGLAQRVVGNYQRFQNEHHGWANPPAFRRRDRLPIIHYWRSFTQCILHDPAYPERAIYPHENGETATFSTNFGIHHFGYSQRPEIVEYKQHVHGHKAEWRKDDWFNSIFMTNRQYDTHPVGSEYWQPEQVDPFALGLPEFMREHPYANLEVIGDVVQGDTQ